MLPYHNLEGYYPFSSFKSSSTDSYSFTDLISIKYPVNGSIKSGVISLQIQFSPSDLSINYEDVQYSDRQLEQKVEDNPNVLRNIDTYLRNKLLRFQYNW
jgi:hypothetical protein